MQDGVNVLRPCLHQVAGHLFEEGKAGSFVDDVGHFYKPLQAGPRGDRERLFYEAIASDLAEEHMWRQSSRRKSLRWPTSSPAAEALKRLNIAQRDELGLIASSPGLSTPRDFSSDEEEEEELLEIGSPSGHSEDELGTVAALITHGADRWGPRRSRLGSGNNSKVVTSNGMMEKAEVSHGGRSLNINGSSRHANMDDVAQLASSPFERDESANMSTREEPEKPACRTFSELHGPLLRVIPRFYGVVTVQDRRLLELEDLAREYHHPCIVDIKIGFRTWYPEAGDESYIERCKRKDAATTQSQLGFKICGMQVWRSSQGGYWRASKRWCKTLPEALVDKALISFTNNELGLGPQHVFGGPNGAVAQLRVFLDWIQVQTTFKFYSSSILLMYEGDATDDRTARVRLRLVDFAHSFRSKDGQMDKNFLDGGLALLHRLRQVQGVDPENPFV